MGLAMAVPDQAVGFSSGAPSGRAGDVVSGNVVQTCAQCHNSFDLNDSGGNGEVTISAPDMIVPGETISVTVAVVNNTPTTGTREQGFSAIVKDPSTGPNGTFVGSYTIPDAAGIRLTSGNTDYVTHTSTGTSQTSWTFQWTAPTVDVPAEVVIYAAGNAANGTGGTSGDYIYTDTHTISVAGVAAEDGPQANIGLAWASLSPNPVRRMARAELALESPMHVEIQLVDGRGRLVRAVASGMRPEGTSSVAVDVHGVAPGTYFLVAETPMGRRTRAVSVVR